MSIRTTVTLDEDVLERVKAESRSRGISFRETLNELLRVALVTRNSRSAEPPFRIKAWHSGPPRPGLNYDSTEELLEYLEGPYHL